MNFVLYLSQRSVFKQLIFFRTIVNLIVQCKNYMQTIKMPVKNLKCFVYLASQIKFYEG